MEWLTQNWFWVLIFIAFFAMHMFGHGSHRHRNEPPRDDNTPPSSGHRH